MRPRARFLAALLCGVAIVVSFAIWRSHRQQALARLERWQERQAIEQTAVALEQKIAVPSGLITLAQLKRAIEEQTDLRVEFADLARWASDFANDASAANWQVELPGGEYPIAQLLRATLNQHNLTYDLGVRRIVITAEHLSEDSSESYVETYPLPQPELASGETDSDSWADSLGRISEQRYWFAGANAGHIETAPGALVVSHTARQHRRIRRVLAEARKLKSPPNDFAPVPLWSENDAQAHARIIAALDEPAAIDWVERPLGEGLHSLVLAHRIPLNINFPKLKEAAIPGDVPITKQLSGVSLRSVLQLILNELDLTYLYQDGALVITTPDHADGAGQMLVAYPVHDLLESGSQRSYQRLIDLITTVVYPHSWAEVGGPASLDGGAIDGWLLVNQNRQAHEAIEFLLAQLRQALRHESSAGVFAFQKANGREEAIWEALDREIELKYDPIPLKDAVYLLSDMLGIPIVINLKMLEESGIRIEEPVRLRFPTRPARQQLNSMLAELELTWLVDNEVLQVTTPDDALSPDRLTIRLYDLRLLKDPDLGVAAANRLLEAIQQIIEPQSWAEAGGPGDLYEFEDILVVLQSRQAHERLEQFLLALQRHCTLLASDGSQPTWVDLQGTARDAQIAESLLKPIDFAVRGVSIEDALQQLSAEQNLPLVIRYADFEAAGTRIDTEIEFQAEQMTLGGVLDRLLEPFEGTYYIQDGALVATSVDGAISNSLPRLYNRQQIARKIGKKPHNQVLDLIKDRPLLSSRDDIGFGIELNHQWMAFYANAPTQRRLELKLAPASSHAQAIAERVALDRERDETEDSRDATSDDRVTAARPYVAKPPVDNNDLFGEAPR